MHKIDRDIAIIGAGTAGLAAYRQAIQAGKSAVILEGGEYGTTCARVGCMPSKLLIAAAEAAYHAEHADGFGVHAVVNVDGKAVMDRVKRERDRFVGFVIEGVENIPPEDRLRGYARFIDQNLLQLDEHTQIRADRVVIAVGSTPFIPPMYRNLGDRLIVNDDVFNWDDLPKKVAVFGPGVIGLELGQALHRLGVEVKVFGVGGMVGPLSDPTIRDYAKATFQADFYLDPNTKIHGVKRIGDEVELSYDSLDGQSIDEKFDYALVATGRVPNLAGLGLENAGLVCDAKGVPLFDRETLQCGKSRVFIAGDANNILPLLHEAADEGGAAGYNAAHYPEMKPIKRRAPLAVVFSEPQIAMIGQRFADLPAGKFVTGEVSFENQGRSRVMLQNKGLMHVYFDRESHRLLGAEWVGPRAENIAHTLAWAYQMQLTVEDMLAMPFYHPVIEEGLRTALRDAKAQL